MTQHSSSTEETPTFQSLKILLDQPPRVKLQLLQHQAEIARLPAGEILEEEVGSLVGERHIPKAFGIGLTSASAQGTSLL